MRICHLKSFTEEQKIPNNLTKRVPTGKFEKQGTLATRLKTDTPEIT